MIETDALVIGAGPVGLFAVFELGLQGIHAHVVDVLAEPGGQCIALYPEKPIYDIPGLPRSTGRELTQNLLTQAAPFKPDFHLSQQCSSLVLQADGRWLLGTDIHHRLHQQFLARSVIIAAGVGAFVPKELKVDGLSEFLDTQVFYNTAPAAALAGQSVVIVGGEETAVAAAIALAQPGTGQARSVTLLYRRDVLQASDAQLAAFDALRASGRIRFLVGQVTAVQTANKVGHSNNSAYEGEDDDGGNAHKGDRLTQLVVSTPDDQTVTLPLDVLLVCQGISPKLGPIADWGLAMQHKQLSVDTATFATSAPGIFAIGDVVTYPGKKKLIVCGFHEATLAAFAIAAQIYPDASQVLQYTTSSALLQRRLGVT